jgi:hypothetical protein
MRTNIPPLDDDSASRLLQDSVHPDDAPPGYGAVAGVLNSAAQLPRLAADEDVATSTITAMVEIIREAGPVPQPSRRKTMLSKLLAGKALAAFAIVGLTASGAAAATGSLPDQAQSVVSGALSHVGVDVPHGDHGNSAGHRKDGDHRPAADENEAGDDNGQPAKPENNGQTTSDDAHTAKTEAVDAGTKIGPAVCEKVSDNKCQAGQHGADNGDADDATPPSNPGTTGQSGEHGKSGDDHGKPDTTPAAPQDDRS